MSSAKDIILDGSELPFQTCRTACDPTFLKTLASPCRLASQQIRPSVDVIPERALRIVGPDIISKRVQAGDEMSQEEYDNFLFFLMFGTNEVPHENIPSSCGPDISSKRGGKSFAHSSFDFAHVQGL